MSGDGNVKLRVAHVRDTYLRATETFIYDIVSRHRAVEPLFLCERVRGAEQFGGVAPRAIEAQGAVTRAANAIARRATHAFPFYTDECRRFGARLIHAHFAPSGYFALSTRRALGIGLVTSFYGQDVFEVPATPRWRRRYAQLFAEGDLFLALSEDMKKDLVAIGCPASKIRIYRLGIDLHDFSPIDRPARETVTILTIARLVEKKGIDVLIRAHARLVTKGLPVRLRIVGDGPLRDSLVALARELGVADRVDFAGRVPFAELPAEFAAADVFSLPSVTDRFGGKDEISMVLKEAMGTALPFVATFHAGIPEVIDDGVNGLLVPERDDARLAAALERLAVDAQLRARIGAEGRRLVERVWEIGRQVEVLEAIYHELAG